MMSRTSWYKTQCFATMAAVGILAALALSRFEFSPTSVGVALVLLLLPGRVLGFAWRDLLRGLRLLNARRFTESRRHSLLFLEAIRRRPYLRYFVWLGSSSYSRDPKVLALNNLGAAELALGEKAAAQSHFEAAMQFDPHCPLPHFNMGVLFAGQGDLSEARRYFRHAASLGYTNGLSDRIVRAAQNRFAHSDGVGTSQESE